MKNLTLNLEMIEVETVVPSDNVQSDVQNFYADQIGSHFDGGLGGATDTTCCC